MKHIENMRRIVDSVDRYRTIIYSIFCTLYAIRLEGGKKGPAGAFGRSLVICGGPSGGRFEALIDPNHQGKKSGRRRRKKERRGKKEKGFGVVWSIRSPLMRLASLSFSR